MLIPSVLYGLYREVRPGCRKVLTRLSRGEPWADIFAAEPRTETRDMPGLLILHGPSPLLGAQPHFHCYLLHSLIREAFLDRKLTAEAEQLVFDDSLCECWSVLGLLSESSTGFFYPEARHLPFLKATLRHWNDFLSEGERYTDGRNWGMTLWSAQTTLSYILVHLGAPPATVTQFYSSGDLTSVLKYVHQEKSSQC